MIMSHSREFVFVRTRKVGGTSVENYLAQFIEDNDIREFKPQGGHPHRGIRRIIRDYPMCKDYYKVTVERNSWDKFISYYYWMTREETPTLDAHWRSDCFGMSIDDYINYCTNKGILSDFEKYTINGKVAVDRIMRYENLRDDLTELCNKLKVPFNKQKWQDSPEFNMKRGIRKDKRHYREILTSEQANKVAKLFRREIKMFGYTF